MPFRYTVPLCAVRQDKIKQKDCNGIYGNDRYPRSSKASGGEDLDIEEPVACRYASAFHFHPTLPGMPGATLVGHQVVQMGQPAQKRLLAPCGVMQAFHGKQFPLDGIMRLIQECAGDRHLGVGEDRIPARLLVLKPASHALAVGRPRRVGDVVGKVA